MGLIEGVPKGGRLRGTNVCTFFNVVCYNGDPFETLIDETRGTETKRLARDKDSAHTAPYAGRKAPR